MNILVDREGRPENLRALLDTLAADASVASILLLAADGNGWTPQTIDPVLTAAGKPVFGGVFPQVLHGNEHLEKGMVALGLPHPAKIGVIEGLSDADRDFDAAVNAAFPDPPARGTMFVLTDGFSRRISALIDALFNNFGLAINYLGGGGGSLSLVQKPCVITPAGLVQDAAVLAWLDVGSGVGVAHGWKSISQSHRVTESEGNVIISLDWRPAFEVYREVVESHSGLRFAADNFFSIAKAYPFGIAKLGAEVVVRDPLMVEGNRLICVGEVPTGAFVHILNGNLDSLVAAAGEARSGAERTFRDGTPTMEIFIDCISRVLFLENDFGLEMAAARNPALPMIGALTIGEIANSGRDYLEFYNKTSVVAML
jgi:hypothetical protein